MKTTLKAICQVISITALPFLSQACTSTKVSLKSDTTELKVQAEQAKKNGDTAAMNLAIKNYAEELHGKLSKHQIAFIVNFATSTRTEAFRFFLNNQDQIDQLNGNLYGTRVLEYIIYQDLLKPFMGKKSPEPDWRSLENTVKQFGTLGFYALSKGKMDYYFETNNWKQFVSAFSSYLKKYQSRLDRLFDGNNRLWDVYEACDDKKILKIASAIQRKIIDIEPDKGISAVYADTYACLLYRSGQKAEAIYWMEKAIEGFKANSDIVQLKVSEENLRKIKADLPTWPTPGSTEVKR